MPQQSSSSPGESAGDHRPAPGPPGGLLPLASNELAAALSLDDALRALARLVVPRLADWYAVDLLNSRGELERAAVHHSDAARLEQVRALEERYPREADAKHGPARVVRTGRPELVEEIPSELLRELARDEEHLRLIEALDLTSYVVTPLVARGRILGAATYVFAESGRRYDREALDVLEDLSSRAALALDNIRLIEELEDARDRLEQQNDELAAQNERLQEQKHELARTLRRADEEHRQKEALLSSAADGIYGLDDQGRCTFINEAGARLLRLDPEQAKGRNMHRLVHHTRRDGSPYPVEDCPIFRAFREGRSVRVDDEVLWRSDGTSFQATYSSSPVLRDGEVVGAVVTFADETERRVVEGRAQLLGRVLDESLNEIYMFDAETFRFVQVNRGGRENLGYEMDELHSMTPLDIKPLYTHDSFSDLVAPLRAGEVPAVRFETIHRRKDGSTYPVDVNLQLAHTATRRLFVAVILDITERREAEEERERLIAQLEEANRAKSEFVSTMSHELRTPLNAVLGYTQLMEDGIPVEVPEQAKAHVRRIALSGRHLLQLIDEILTFSKLEAGREPAHPAPVPLDDLLEEVEAVVRPLAQEKGLGFEAALRGTRRTLVTDPKKLRQILLNLAGNAVKFTERGTVTVTASGDEDGAVLQVVDTGIGMNAAEVERAFEPFWQADQTSTREIGGTGLGLAITRRFVDILGGDIKVDSGPGGTMFTVSLPHLRMNAEPGAPADQAAPADPPTARKEAG